MPSLDWNLEQWDRKHDWAQDGAEWSTTWGSDRMQWFGALLPRIQAFLPAPTILEIAPGFGRWTAFLQPYCRHLHAVDLSANCIDYCRTRFADLDNISYSVNDGMHLDAVADNSIDFAFSFDSLVHVEDNVIASYLHELRRVLSGNGVAFIHHSNLGEFRSYFQAVKALKRWLSPPPPAVDAAGEVAQTSVAAAAAGSGSDRQAVLARLRKGMGIDSDHSRALSMSAARFRELADQAGLKCISQETINWGTRRTIDCLSTVAPRESAWPEGARLSNPRFMQEAANLRSLAALYDAPRLRANEVQAVSPVASS